MLHFVTAILIFYSSFTHLTALPALVPGKPTAVQLQKENSSYTHIHICMSGQGGRDKTRSDMAECSWSIQASLEVSNQQLNSTAEHNVFAYL